MASQERTESATPRRRDEVRRRGQTARSAEINSAAALLASFLFVRAWGPGVVTECLDMFRMSFENLNQPDLSVLTVTRAFMSFGMLTGSIVAPAFALMMAIGVVANVSQVGLLLTFHPLQPNLAKLNPLEGAKRLISMRSLVDLLKAIVKLAIVGYVAWRVVDGRLNVLLALPVMPWQAGVGLVLEMVFDVGIWASSCLLVLAVLDYAYQRRQFEQGIRMSREEVKEELKQTEGNPVIKQRVRQLQRAVAQRRMMQAVPRADVVITNPTHLAIALDYDARSMRAPRVVAKGEGFIAEQIKRVAREHGVPTMENKPLARALFKSCEIGQEIPGDLYAAVAEVLAFVYRLKSNRGLSPVPAAP